MTSTRPEHTDPAGALREAERRIRRLERLTVFLLLGFVLSLGTQFLPRDKTNSAQKFVLVDPRGTQRGEIMLREEDGSPALRLDNGAGRARVMLNARTDGSAFVRLSDNSGFHRALLEVDPDGTPALTLMTPNGTPRLTLGLNAAGDPRIAMLDSARRVIWSAP
jgi:hypothetical protein